MGINNIVTKDVKKYEIRSSRGGNAVTQNRPNLIPSKVKYLDKSCAIKV